MNNLTQIVNEWLRSQRDLSYFFISPSTKAGLWKYDQIMYMDPKKCEVIRKLGSDINTSQIPACDLYMVGFVEELGIAPWYDRWRTINAHDPKFFSKLKRLLRHIEDTPQKSYFIRRFYNSTKEVKKGYYNGLWH